MHTLSQHGSRESFDVLIIGSGMAGLSFCLELLRLRPKTRIALISKVQLSESNSYYAQGGIAAVTSSDDSLKQHANDTFLSGDGLSNPDAVKTILSEAPHVIQNLRDCGVAFDEDLTREGGHSHRRIFHCGDRTGRVVMDALLAKIHANPAITVFESHMAVNLLVQDKAHQPGYHGEVIGAYVLDTKTDLIHTFLANAVVLATGGAGKIYRYTTNPDVATGDGLAMAYRAGARVGNLEFYQFHPTLLYHPECRNFLISEAVRGEGGYLRLPGTGERFMQRYAPDSMELATRDVVARAIFNEIERGDYNYVHLDITHRPKAFLQQHFPAIYSTLLQLGIDMSRDKIPVVPAAHYQCGGILTDTSGHTDKERLYAIGEVTFTGLHGANRLASNSLVEAGVMAIHAARDCCKWLEQPVSQQPQLLDWDSKGVTDLRRAGQINAHWRSLRGEMTSYAGIVRTEAGLKDLRQLILTRSQMIEEYYWHHAVTRDLLELRNIILVAELIVRSALKRRESRGGHYREDYPEKASQQLESVLQVDDFREYL
jgi:L-aspartate oxidase